MIAEKQNWWATVQGAVVLLGSGVQTFLYSNQYYQIHINQTWEILPLAEAGHWVYRSPAFFGYYLLANTIIYFILFLISGFAIFTHRGRLLKIAGSAFLGFYILSYLIKLL